MPEHATGVSDAPCLHRHVVRDETSNGPIWVCDRCTDMFVSIDALQRLEAETNGAIDMACAMFANVIQGLYNAQGKPPPAFADTTTRDCDTEGHEFENGACKHCAASQFLGGN